MEPTIGARLVSSHLTVTARAACGSLPARSADPVDAVTRELRQRTGGEMHHTVASVCVIGGLVAILAAQETSRTHDLPLAPQNVHWGYYDARVTTALRIMSGDRVRVETMVARGVQRLKLAGVTDAEIPNSMQEVERVITDRGPGGHPLTGPIFVEGAAPGDVLEVRLLAIDFLHPFGVAAFSPGGGVLPADFPYVHLQLLRWQPGADSVEFRPGVRLKFAPFFGSIGVAPPVLSGRISSTPPGWHGGNLDNKDLVVGSVLYLPVHVSGALLSIGDGHAMRATGKSPARLSRRHSRQRLRSGSAKGNDSGGLELRAQRTTSRWV
jgi:hypothetical protein